MNEIKVPEGWEVNKLGDNLDFLSGFPFKSSKFTKNPLDFGIIRIRNLQNQKLETFYNGDILEDFIVKKGDILIGMDGDFNIVKWKSRKGLLNQRICKIINKINGFDINFSHYVLIFELQKIQNKTAATTVKHLSIKNLKEIKRSFPPLPEQRKIASILTSVDEVIEKTEAQIQKLLDLKKATMNELLTRGIGHNEFEDTAVGRIPKDWKIVRLNEVLTPDMVNFNIQDDGEYSPVIVKRRHGGIETREIKKGSKILVKNQYYAVPGRFLISKRQIFHGSCGIIPNQISKNAIISKEYLQLKPTSILDIEYFNYFSHLPLFQEIIKRTTYGVDVEKYVFKDKWWFKEQIPLPQMREQLKIRNAIQSIEKTISRKIAICDAIKNTKKALMQDLLTGRVRVKGIE